MDDFDHFEYPRVDDFNKNAQNLAIYFFKKLQYMYEK